MQIVICISKQMLVSVSAVTAAISTENCSSPKFGEELWTENQRIWNQTSQSGTGDFRENGFQRRSQYLNSHPAKTLKIKYTSIDS